MSERLLKCDDCGKRMRKWVALFRTVVDDRGPEMGGYCTESKWVCGKCAKKYER